MSPLIKKKKYDYFLFLKFVFENNFKKHKEQYFGVLRATLAVEQNTQQKQKIDAFDGKISSNSKAKPIAIL